MRKDILKVIEDDEETIRVEFEGTFEDLFNGFEAVSRAALEMMEIITKNFEKFKEDCEKND